jgi:hypothetical protein
MVRACFTDGDGSRISSTSRAHHRDADLHLRHAGRVERARDGQLLVVAEGHAGGLLTVTQRGVVDAIRRAPGLGCLPQSACHAVHAR